MLIMGVYSWYVKVHIPVDLAVFGFIISIHVERMSGGGGGGYQGIVDMQIV